ncbi:DUF1223 domain-containing protein [Aquimarina longa]|uniref:DUF1223 domain-containing protein n=1 Tax=Aquimarina longa TaxID=1080221 RepID=UPI0007860664|nr:DUF1223 domain-containing protein [Aquimarina longa]
MQILQKLTILLLLIFSALINAQENNSGSIVLELFTSQGCSSCPSADKLLDNINQKHNPKNVITLSYHVDYWNRLGWKDPYSSPLFSDYQRNYATQFSSKSIYTPQLVINGSEHFIGSNSYKTNIALKKYSKIKPETSIIIKNVKRQNFTVVFDYTIKGESFNTITLALVVAERITSISQGENRNRSIKNINIVANRLVKKEKTGTASITIPNWIKEKDQLSIIAYTQKKSLKITGADKVTL